MIGTAWVEGKGDFFDISEGAYCDDMKGAEGIAWKMVVNGLLKGTNRIEFGRSLEEQFVFELNKMRREKKKSKGELRRANRAEELAEYFSTCKIALPHLQGNSEKVKFWARNEDTKIPVAVSIDKESGPEWRKLEVLYDCKAGGVLWYGWNDVFMANCAVCNRYLFLFFLSFHFLFLFVLSFIQRIITYVF